MSLESNDVVTQQFRNAMRVHAAGVSILTTEFEGRRFGMTATAVTSLTMNPPALAVCINRSASIHQPIVKGGAFCVNIMRAEDADLCDKFSKLPTEDRFTIGTWAADENHLPILSQSQASISCRVGPTMEFGSHTIIVGEVIGAVVSPDVSPLLYINGGYRFLSAT